MTTFWALVANNGSAKLFEIKGMGKHVRMLREISHPDGRVKKGETTTDKPGRTFSPSGSGSFPVSSEIDSHKQATQEFARQLVQILKGGSENKEFDRFSIIAAPSLLGELNKQMPDKLKGAFDKQINKDLPDSLNEKELVDRVCEYLDLWNH